MLVLAREDVAAVLDPRELIDVLATAMADLSAGRTSMGTRVAAFVPERGGFLGAMPAHVPSLGVLTAKLVTLFPQNAGSAVPTHQAIIAAFDPETGEPTALMDGTEITAVRTAAGSALSARLLARADARVLTIVGTGVQAGTHARIVPLVREIGEVRVAGRTPAKAEALAAELAAEGLPARAFDSPQEAVAGADIVCATTSAEEPAVRREWLSPGAHVTSVGFSTEGRELDDATVADALVVVEARETALAPIPAGANDLLEPIRTGVIGPDHIHAEIGELVEGTAPGRTSPEQLTLYKSMGVAVQDAAAAALVLSGARDRGLGTNLDI
jgi:ornithine cyclodeaminase